MTRAVQKRRTRTIYRSAITGRFVSRAHAEAHPDVTVSATVRVAEHALREPVGEIRRRAKASGR